VSDGVRLQPDFPVGTNAGRLGVTLAKITAIIGEGKVGTGMVEDTRPGDDFHIEPFSIPRKGLLALGV
jgi:hypothetical protein